MHLQDYYFIPKIEGPKCQTIYDHTIIKGTIIGHQIHIISPKYFAHIKPIVSLQDFLILTSKSLKPGKIEEEDFYYLYFQGKGFSHFSYKFYNTLKEKKHWKNIDKCYKYLTKEFGCEKNKLHPEYIDKFEECPISYNSVSKESHVEYNLTNQLLGENGQFYSNEWA